MHDSEIDNLDSLLSGWLDSGRRSSVHTQEAYRRDVKAFLAYSRKPITQTQPGDLINYQAYLRQQVGSTATEYRKLTSLRSFFKYLKLTKEIAEDLAAVIQTPKVESDFKSKALSVDEVKAIINAAGLPDSLLLRLLYVTGGRISELLALRWVDMTPAEEGGGYARILGKGRKCREVYIGPELWADLATTEPLNTKADHEPLFDFDRHEAAAIVSKAAKAAKIGKAVTPHMLRHSLASNLLEGGATLAQVRDQLGHADIKTTSLYLHATDRAAMIRDMPIK